jgi:hypothetical protein
MPGHQSIGLFSRLSYIQSSPLGDAELAVVRLEITTRSQASVGGATSGGAPCLAAAARVDEVKKIFDQAVAMKMYAFQVRDPDLIGPSTEIKSRATYVPEEHEIELLVRQLGRRQIVNDGIAAADFGA